MNLNHVLAGLTPTADEQSAMEARCERLIAECAQALDSLQCDGTPTVQGSVAKGTWLRTSADMDCFILLDPGVPEEDLERITTAVASEVLTDSQRKYAQHPYIMGTFDGVQVDLVPAYRVAEPTARMSAVDRTPFHTEWVRTNLDDAARNDVRLLKQWCKGVGIYGAETRIGGFSGYLLEVLVHHLGGFDAVLAWFADECQPRRVAGEADEVDDDVSPVVVVDPVDPARNCAAAVQETIIADAAVAAASYAQAPTEAFFHPPVAKAEDADVLEAALNRQNAQWLSIELRPATDRLDIVFPQFQKAARTVAAELERAGFPVHRHRVDAWNGDATVGMQWLVSATPLPAEKIHAGPPAAKEPNASGFRKKWDGHPDAIAGVEEVDGRLQVRVRVPHRTGYEWLQAHLSSMAFGKHVANAIGREARVHNHPASIDPAWAPTVTEFILDRRPWQRPAS